MSKSQIGYGTVLKAIISSNEVDTVVLVNNVTAGDGFGCLVLDLRTMEILTETKDVDSFRENYEIIERVGDFNELCNLQ